MVGANNSMQHYAVRTMLFMAGYIAINVGAMLGAFDDLQRPGAYGFALAVAAPVVGQIWATLSYMHNADEFLGRLMARRFIVAAGIAMAIASAWGFAEAYAGAPHAPGWMIYPLFWFLFGLLSMIISSTR